MKLVLLGDAGSIHTQRWAKFFANRGHEVHLVTFILPASADFGTVKLHTLRSWRIRLKFFTPFVNLFIHYVQVKRLLRKLKPDIVHAHYLTDFGLLGALVSFSPFVVSAWGSDILVDPDRNRIFHLITAYVLKKADLVVTDGKIIQEKIKEFGISPEKLRYVLFGVDTRKFRPEGRDEGLRTRLGIPKSPAIISNRSLEPIYDVGSLVRAAPSILGKFATAMFIIVGDGSQREYLVELARDLGVSANFKFVGRISNDEMPHVLALADVYVSTSLSDTVSVSLLEAMASGLAPVVTEVGDVREWISDGNNGFIVPPRRPDLLAEKIIYLLEHPETASGMGTRNRQSIVQKADQEKEIDKMENIYLGLLKTRHN